MTATRRGLIAMGTGAVLSAFNLGRARAQAARNAPRVTVDSAQIYLIRGLFNVFSTGMDELATQFRAQGYSQTTLWTWTDVDVIANDIIAGNRRGDNSHVVVVGHSLGSNSVVLVADRVMRESIPIDLAVTFDITEDLIVPPNVARFINFYQNNGFGRPALKPPGFRGELRNINLSDQVQLNHGNMDNSPQLQAYVRDQVYQITHTHIRSVEAKRKSKKS